MRTRKEFETFIKGLYPEAVFTYDDGTDIFYIAGRELQFYPTPEARATDSMGEKVHSCFEANGRLIETNDF